MSTAGIVLYSSAQQLQTPIRVEVALLVCVNRVQLCFLRLQAAFLLGQTEACSFHESLPFLLEDATVSLQKYMDFYKNRPGGEETRKKYRLLRCSCHGTSIFPHSKQQGSSLALA